MVVAQFTKALVQISNQAQMDVFNAWLAEYNAQQVCEGYYVRIKQISGTGLYNLEAPALTEFVNVLQARTANL